MPLLSPLFTPGTFTPVMLLVKPPMKESAPLAVFAPAAINISANSKFSFGFIAVFAAYPDAPVVNASPAPNPSVCSR